ncbi:uncharacterized protein LY79DRAFT_533930 [Colletotrichum navitas]|uniref:Secreted protein n=1 Tax=Colletotrichum navitas TaxID=681940 RepID=A0AAD8QG40_9PEZI|nr:uncharacterized protein LY79DRAFT_533930 [Colletotrichum navitas]KAK1600539.1 hypothetical protein LY79DRAFT_533930 [Colletotrichum navitas]
MVSSVFSFPLLFSSVWMGPPRPVRGRCINWSTIGPISGVVVPSRVPHRPVPEDVCVEFYSSNCRDMGWELGFLPSPRQWATAQSHANRLFEFNQKV